MLPSAVTIQAEQLKNAAQPILSFASESRKSTGDSDAG